MRIIIAALCAMIVSAALAETPKLIGRVNDHAGVLTVDQRATLERKLEAIEKTEGHPQVAVLLPAIMDGADIERFANATYHAWKLGQSGKDNGILIVIAPKERKWRIEVGYGLESVIPDSRAKAIITNDMDPHLKGGKTGFYEALDAAASSIATELAKDRTPTRHDQASDDSAILGLILVFGGAIGIILIALAFRSRRLDDGPEAVTRPSGERRSDNTFGAAAAGAALGGGIGVGIAAAAIASHPRTRATRRDDDEPRRSSSSSSDWGSSSGSSSSTWSSDSGSSSFSGGGGDSGGGGASGGD